MLPTVNAAFRPTIAGSTFALVLSLVLSPVASAAMREDEYVARVLSAGLDARVLQAEADLARAEAVGAGLWPSPSIEWERQPNPTEDRVVGGQHTIVASIPLVLSGRLGLEASAADRSADAAEARRDRARAEIRSEATLAFASVIAATERMAVFADSLAALDELSRIIARREEAGEASGYERSRISLERGLAANEREAADIESQQALANALRLLGPDVSRVDLAGSVVPERSAPDVGQLLDSLEIARADLAAIRLDKESAELAGRAASRRWIPDPAIRAGALVLEDAQHGEAVGGVVGLQIEVPLFDRGQGERARAEAQRSLAVARYARLLQAARSELTLAAETLRTRRTRLLLHRDDVLMPARELRGSAAAGYRGGEMDLLALVDAERNAREAELAAITLALEVREAETRLLLVSGAFDNAQRSMK
jgi:cobalt-zinc-cadmium efflux system outer membrane protein